MSWKPKFKKENERFKNLPPLKTFITVVEKKKRNKYEYSDELFPTLGPGDGDVLEKSSSTKLEQSEEDDGEGWTEVISKNKNPIEQKEEIIVEKEQDIEVWDEEDSLEEYFEIMNSGLVADINIFMSDFCKECGVHIYNSYDRGHNLINLIKETSTEYDDIFIKDNEEKIVEDALEEENEEDAQNENLAVWHR